MIFKCIIQLILLLIIFNRNYNNYSLNYLNYLFVNLNKIKIYQILAQNIILYIL
jgi:hypothetical protein